MSYTFTLEQQAQITALKATAEADLVNNDYAEVYQYIADLLFEQNIDVPTGSGNHIHFVSLADQDPEIRQVALWFAGAAQVNAGEGFFSVLIREYTSNQLELRDSGWAVRSQSEKDALMQEASNKVAQNALNNIIFNPDRNVAWELPTLGEIAEKDAIGTGEILFNSAQFNDDSAHPASQNSAWSGAILFSMLDASDTPSSEQTARLLGDDGQLNTLADFRDVLFAYQSFVSAFDTTYADTSLSDAAFNGADDISVALKTFISDPYFANPFNAESVLVEMTQGDTSNDALRYIKAFGADGLLSKMMDLFGDQSQGILPSLSFNEKAQTLFTNLGASDKLSLRFETISNSVVDFTSASDSAKALAYRYALVNLNSFAIIGNENLYDQHNTNHELDLFNTETGEGTLTNHYLQDRALLLSAVIQQNIDDAEHPNKINGQAIRFYDQGSPVGHRQIFAGANNSGQGGANTTEADKTIYFGDDNSNTQNIRSNKTDHIYGGKGEDTLYGGGGNDYIEGNKGNDTLYGEAGSDTLIGGAGGDNLHGGASGDHADILDGGQGHDIYHIETSDGDTIIRDSDLDGEIRFDGKSLGSSGDTILNYLT